MSDEAIKEGMKRIYVSVSTNKVGSWCETYFDIEKDALEEDIEDVAKYVMFEMIDWYFSEDKPTHSR